ncbi:MAG TPA: hypothetical protein VEL47_02255 [Myxococcota bacterium]|nr:hypothetical protein [Myxococcota bacterium]
MQKLLKASVMSLLLCAMGSYANENGAACDVPQGDASADERTSVSGETKSDYEASSFFCHRHRNYISCLAHNCYWDPANLICHH